MRKAVLLGVLLFVLISCQGDLPPVPPPPGVDMMAGRAIGGIPVPNGTLPAWAVPILNTDVEPASPKDGQSVRVTIEKPQGTTQRFYAHGQMYFFNKKSRVWEKISVDPAQSGKIAQAWVEDKAVFYFTADKSRFDPGVNYLTTYWCLDTGTRDTNGNKVWSCNGNKWGLGGFDLRVGFPELIEADLQTYKYQRSNLTVIPDGNQFEAFYLGPSGVVPVSVLKLKNATAHKRLLAQNLPLLDPIWRTLVGVCGFVQQDAVLGTTLTWISNDTRVTIPTVLGDDARIISYAQRYPSDCRLIDELRRLAVGQEGYCGNGFVEVVEQCDSLADAACPGACKPDCTCALRGDPGAGICGDLVVQQPNKDNVLETCEPPMTRDIVTGQIKSGSLCFVRDPVSQAVSPGNCDTQCKCVPGLIELPKCGNGVCDAGETAQSCGFDCPRDVLPPVLRAIIPQEGQSITAPFVAVVDARDAFGVGACSVRFGEGAVEALAKNATAWSKSVAVVAGASSAQFTCGDAAGNNASITVPFTVV